MMKRCVNSISANGRLASFAAWGAVALIVNLYPAAIQADEAGSLDKLRSVGPNGAGHRAAIAAWNEVAQSPAERLPVILGAMDGASDLAANWIRAAAESVAQRSRQSEQPLPLGALETFLADVKHSPRARQTAYDLIAASDAGAADRLIPSFLNDPSMELRRLAVARELAGAEKLAGDEGRKADAVAAYRRALSAARDTDQIDAAAEQLKKLGDQVDLPRHFGFVMRWHLIGPFDNRETKGFDVAYPPEQQVDLNGKLAGVDGEVAWTSHTTEDAYGTVDLNTAMGKHKGAIAYAYAEFVSDEERDVEIRFGCINGNKLWLNGELLTTNHVYHAGEFIDQYKGIGRLKKGRNEILLKVAQNEQTEDWAQRWQFQLRVCDPLGTAVLAADRPATTQVSSSQ